MDHLDPAAATSSRSGEYTSERRAGRSRRSGESDRRPRANIRGLYFGAAALWGFLVGVIGMAVRDLAGRKDGVLAAVLLAGAVLAIGGSGVLAAAYREARKRAGH